HKAVAELTEEIAQVTDVGSVARVTTGRLQKLTRLESALFVQDAGPGVLALVGATPPRTTEVRFSPDGAFAELLREPRAAQLARSLLDTGRIPAEEAARLASLRARLVVPLFARDALFGLLLLGGDRFDDLFTTQDRQLLEGVQNPLGMALQN